MCSTKNMELRKFEKRKKTTYIEGHPQKSNSKYKLLNTILEEKI